MKRHQKIDFDRVLIDWADEFLQDLMASFSARRPTVTLRMAVAGLYLFAAFHLVWAGILPFFRDAIADLIGASTAEIPHDPLVALATGIVVGGVSFHVLLAMLYVLLSFVVRAARRWTIAVGTAILTVNVAVAFNGLRSATVAGVFLALHWTSLVLAISIIALIWISAVAPAAARGTVPAKRYLSNEGA